MRKLNNKHFYFKISLLIIAGVFFIGLIPNYASATTDLRELWREVWGESPSISTPPQSCNDYCTEWQGPNYCSGNSIYQQRTCYRRIYSNGNCYANSSYTDTRLVFDCGASQKCQNGQCVDACECTSGPCCDGCHYKSATATCNFETQSEYGCPWGTDCGADVGKKTKTRWQYCTGVSPQCNGRWGDWSDWSNWMVADNCSTKEVCAAGTPQCQSSSGCASIVIAYAPTYIKNFRKGCEGNTLFWFDTNGVKQGVAQECSDNNECTQDSCQGTKCLNELKCDGSTCAVGSDNYCQKCNHCGDNVCNCGETLCSCANDCKGDTLTVVFLGKNGGTPLQWVRNLRLESGEKIDFLMVIKNEGEKLDNVMAQTTLPAEIIYKGDLKLNGESFSGDIKEGINIGSVDQKEVKVITFRGEVVGKGITQNKEIEITGTAKVANLSNSDSIKVALEGKGSGLAAIGSAFKSLTKTGVWLPLLITIILLWFIVKMIRIWFFEK